MAPVAEHDQEDPSEEPEKRLPSDVNLTFCQKYYYTFLGLLVLIGVPALTIGLFKLFSGHFVGSNIVDDEPLRWSYDQGQNIDQRTASSMTEWPGYYCNRGLRQSPVDIPTNQLLSQVFAPTALNFTGINRRLNVQLANHQEIVVMRVPPMSALRVNGGGLDEEYALQKVLIHWAQSETDGSEHSIMGRKYPVEIQLLFIRTGFSERTAKRLDHGHLGVSVLVEVDWSNRYVRQSTLDAVGDAFSRIRQNEQFVNLDVRMADLLPANYQTYFEYSGSETVPKCSESFTWLVMKYPIYVTRYFISELRLLNNGLGQRIRNNSRPIQAINGRQIKLYSSGQQPWIQRQRASYKRNQWL